MAVAAATAGAEVESGVSTLEPAVSVPRIVRRVCTALLAAFFFFPDFLAARSRAAKASASLSSLILSADAAWIDASPTVTDNHVSSDLVLPVNTPADCVTPGAVPFTSIGTGRTDGVCDCVQVRMAHGRTFLFCAALMLAGSNWSAAISPFNAAYSASRAFARSVTSCCTVSVAILPRAWSCDPPDLKRLFTLLRKEVILLLRSSGVSLRTAGDAGQKSAGSRPMDSHRPTRPM